MKRLLALLLVALAAPTVQAGAPLNTIITDNFPPYLFPSSGTPVPVGGSATATVVLSNNTGGPSLLTLVGLVPGSDFQITGGTCAPGSTTFIAPGDNCTLNLQFVATSPGTRSGTMHVDCAPFVPAGGLVINCDGNTQTFASIALSGFAGLLASVPVPVVGRYELTALAMLLFALAGWSLRRKP